MDQAFEEGQVTTVDTALTRLTLAKSMFYVEDEHGEQKRTTLIGSRLSLKDSLRSRCNQLEVAYL
jgi:hypothetical protein